MWGVVATFLEEKKGETIPMTEFAFEGGHREGPDFLQHYEDRQKGLPRVNASLSSGYQPDGAWGPVLPLPSPGRPAPEHCPLGPIKVYRMDSHGLGLDGTGLMGELPPGAGGSVWIDGIIPPQERLGDERDLKRVIKEKWGGGRYRLQHEGHGDYDLVISGPSKPLLPSSPDGGGVKGALSAKLDAEIEKPVEVGATVWLDLSRSGPYKVVGKYEHPLGASVPAHHPHDAPNTFETVRVIEGLWLCQDVKGVVHILAEGSLTTTPPASRFSKISQLGTWCWSKREVVLWVSLAGTIAALAL